MLLRSAMRRSKIIRQGRVDERMKKITYTNAPNIGQNHENPARHRKDPAHPVEPLSGSKKVKNRQHSRANHGEGF
jgi:hypothetical protein